MKTYKLEFLSNEIGQKFYRPNGMEIKADDAKQAREQFKKLMPFAILTKVEEK